ncbi:hypothetical protein B7463_g8256, partial [Scytalidium lignicola]
MTRILQTIYSEGIFHGLPTFPDHDGKKYTAIVTGANGISGSEMVNVLAAAPERWETIYAMSRRLPASTNPRIKNIAADFLNSTPEALATLFKEHGIKADYIFFTSYIQPPAKEGAGLWSNTDELGTANVSLLSNFLKALTLASIIPKRFLLQTGGKHYAVHLGPAEVPMTEGTTADRVDHDNFYFPQEDLLSAWASEHNTSWTVTRPGFILGSNDNAAMNVTYGLAIYASVQKELGRSLGFPADILAWDASKDLSTSRLIAYHAEWAVLTKEAANQALNIVDNSPFAYGKFWPQLASWYGIRWETPEKDEGKYMTVTMPRDPPPRGFGPAGQVKFVWGFEQWAQGEEVKSAWERIQEREGLNKEFNPFRPDKIREVFGTLDADVLGPWTRTMSMDKSRKLGWHGHVQTDEAIKGVIDKMVELKMVPRF